MKKEIKLINILRGLNSVVVAYSGGLDSTFLLKVAVDTLGKQNVLAVTARSETYPESEFREAKQFAKKIGANHIIIFTNELKSKKFTANPVNRCYYCKLELFRKLEDLRRKHNFGYVLDGTNYDDLKDVRHGRKAAKELRVLSPLLDAGMTKPDIRRFSKKLKLPTWDKPSFACLASRFPFKTAISKPGLQKVDKAEEVLRKLGFRQFRVRLHGDIARIEVLENDIKRVVELKASIVKSLKALGFIYVALDLAGYRTGSMHEVQKHQKALVKDDNSGH